MGLWGRAAVGVLIPMLRDLSLVVGELGILAFLFPRCFLLNQGLLFAGAALGLRLPPGW